MPTENKITLKQFPTSRKVTRTCSSAKGNSLQHIRGPSNTAVYEELKPVVRKSNPSHFLEFVDNLGKNLNARSRAV
jgi:hypothetical protein